MNGLTTHERGYDKSVGCGFESHGAHCLRGFLKSCGRVPSDTHHACHTVAMARPPIPIGSFGKITTLPIPGGRFEARCRFRDYDGMTRLVGRQGKTAAENNLKAALRKRQGPAGAQINSDTRQTPPATAARPAATGEGLIVGRRPEPRSVQRHPVTAEDHQWLVGRAVVND